MLPNLDPLIPSLTTLKMELLKFTSLLSWFDIHRQALPSHLRSLQTAAAITTISTYIETHAIFLIVVAILFAPFLLTRIYTGIQAFVTYKAFCKAEKLGAAGCELREPIQAPYWIPYVGNLPSIVWDFEGFLSKLKYKYNSKPISLQVLGLKIYVPTSAHDIQAVYRKSDTLSFDRMLLHVIKTVCGIHPAGLEILKIGAHGIPQRPGITEEEIRATEVITSVHKSYTKYLSGAYVEAMTGKFQEIIINKITEMYESRETNNKEVDIHIWCRRIIFEASITVLFGDYLLEMNPALWDDMWAFDPNMFVVALEIPRWLKPEPYEQRDRMLKAFAKWQEFVMKKGGEAELKLHIDSDAGEEERFWDPIYGAALTRERIHLFTTRGLDHEGSASMHFVFFFALLTNVIPSITWMFLHMLTTPHTIPTLRQEIHSSRLDLDEKASTISPLSIRFDIKRLSNPELSPLINSFFNESLRLSVSIFSLRVVLADTEIGAGAVFKQGSFVIAPTRLIQLDRGVWRCIDGTTGRSRRETEFWPERFLGENMRGKEDVRNKERGNKPFGGGLALCPGRFLAKNEVLTLFAAVLELFDLEVVKVGGGEVEEGNFGFREAKRYVYGSGNVERGQVWEGSGEKKKIVGVNDKFFGLGGMPPEKEVWVRFKLRKLEG